MKQNRSPGLGSESKPTAEEPGGEEYPQRDGLSMASDGLDLSGLISHDRNQRLVLAFTFSAALIAILAVLAQNQTAPMSAVCSSYDSLLIIGIVVGVIGVVLGAFRLFRVMMVVVAIGVILAAIAIGNLSGLGCTIL